MLKGIIFWNQLQALWWAPATHLLGNLCYQRAYYITILHLCQYFTTVGHHPEPKILSGRWVGEWECFNSGSSVLSHPLPRMTPVTSVPHTTCTSAYQDFSAKLVLVPLKHVVAHYTICIRTPSLSISSFRQYLAICLHELTCALWSHHDCVPASQQISTHLHFGYSAAL